MVVNQNASGLNRGLSSNFCRSKSANHMKFKEACVMCREKRMLTNELNEFVTLSVYDAQTWD